MWSVSWRGGALSVRAPVGLGACRALSSLCGWWARGVSVSLRGESEGGVGRRGGNGVVVCIYEEEEVGGVCVVCVLISKSTRGGRQMKQAGAQKAVCHPSMYSACVHTQMRNAID